MIIGCTYHKDKLIIKNNSSKNIDYEIFIKVKSNESGFKYKIISASGDFDYNNNSSPIVRNYISDEIDKNSCDSILYIYIYDKIDHDFFYKHMDSIIYSKNVNFYKYSKQKLDSLNWVIDYK